VALRLLWEMFALAGRKDHKNQVAKMLHCETEVCITSETSQTH